MKETVDPKAKRPEDEGMPEELDLDWSKAKPNPYAGRIRHTVTVTLDPDVAKVFRTPEAVNKALRAFIEAMPKSEEKKAA